MHLGVIADDFTGASDVANTLVRGGMATLQSVGIPSGASRFDCDALVVSLKTRTVPVAHAVRDSCAALDWLKSAGCTQFLFKYCSTFDSTREGNIGPVAEALRARLGAAISIVCPAGPSLGRTSYNGHLFVNGRLLSESGMQNHPLTPMTDPDIRRWMSYQTKVPVALIDYRTVRNGSDAIRAALAEAAAAGHGFAVVDAVDDADLITLGAAVSDHVLVTGGSGIGKGLAENFRKRVQRVSRKAQTSLSGPGVALCGSCSQASRKQTARHAAKHPSLAVTPADLISGRMSVSIAASFVRENSSRMPIVFSTAEPTEVAAAQQRFGSHTAASIIERFFGELAVAIRANGVTRIVVGGGETSGAVVTALELELMQVGAEIDPGVPMLSVDAPSPLRLALKSGNFGSDDFFEKALDALATGRGAEPSNG